MLFVSHVTYPVSHQLPLPRLVLHAYFNPRIKSLRYSSYSRTNTELMALEVIAIYMSNSSPVLGFVKSGGELRYCFNLSKDF